VSGDTIPSAPEVAVSTPLFEALDYLYLPAPDIDTSVAFYTETLGGELLWRIRDGDTWVAAVRLVPGAPLVVLANHLAPGRGLQVYRARSLAETQRTLAAHGWSLEGEPFELPQGPCVVLRDPGEQRLAAYERVRPGMDERFQGRFDAR
jgi:catechol 2,3-dioxygenase-like lactoylglutathione lyase family enzyme